jgi:condensin-2 complex subunit D3
VEVSKRVVTVIQALISPAKHWTHFFDHSPLLSDGSNNNNTNNTSGLFLLSSLKRNEVESIRASAFVTLGKLCLQEDNLAKQCIPAFAAELSNISNDDNDPQDCHALVRNNVIVVMCDLCMKYTALVDKYIGQLAVALKDRSPLIRRQTLILLARFAQ